MHFWSCRSYSEASGAVLIGVSLSNEVTTIYEVQTRCDTHEWVIYGRRTDESEARALLADRQSKPGPWSYRLVQFTKIRKVLT